MSNRTTRTRRLYFCCANRTRTFGDEGWDGLECMCELKGRHHFATWLMAWHRLRLCLIGPTCPACPSQKDSPGARESVREGHLAPWQLDGIFFYFSDIMGVYI